MKYPLKKLTQKQWDEILKNKNLCIALRYEFLKIYRGCNDILLNLEKEINK